jgi:hypothetical protein
LEWTYSNLDWHLIKPNASPVLKRKAMATDAIDMESVKKSSEGPRKRQKTPKKQGNVESRHICAMPEGTHWSNNSCAYDAIITMLFNTWKEHMYTNNITWTEINNEVMSELLQGFNDYANRPVTLEQHHLSLEEVHNSMQRNLGYLSDQFQFGSFTSISSVLKHVLKCNRPITSWVRRCRVRTHPTIRETIDNTCLVTTYPLPNQSLQEHLNNFHQELSSCCELCGQLQVRVTTFNCLPPLLAFQWVGGNAPMLEQEINITANTSHATYTLRGVIHYTLNHFTAHIVLASGTWFHDGIVTGQSLAWQPLQQQHQDTVIVLFIAKYQPHKNLELPCKAMAY